MTTNKKTPWRGRLPKLEQEVQELRDRLQKVEETPIERNTSGLLLGNNPFLPGHNRSLAMEMLDVSLQAPIQAKILGLFWGGLVPFFTFMVVHHEYRSELGWKQWALVMAIGGLLYSSRKVYDFSRVLFRESLGAIGFVVSVEGVMTFSGLYWLSLVGFIILFATNWIVATCNVMGYEYEESVPTVKMFSNV